MRHRRPSKSALWKRRSKRESRLRELIDRDLVIQYRDLDISLGKVVLEASLGYGGTEYWWPTGAPDGKHPQLEYLDYDRDLVIVAYAKLILDGEDLFHSPKQLRERGVRISKVLVRW